MIPSASQIMARRWWARTCVRAAALVALLIGLAGGIGSGGQSIDVLQQVSQLGMSSGALNITSLIVGLLVQTMMPLGVAATLIWFERRIVRWLVPIPTHRCPRCDYSLIGVHDPRCPECGLPLDEGVTRSPSDEDPTPLTRRAAAASPTHPPSPSPAPRRRETQRPDPE